MKDVNTYRWFTTHNTYAEREDYFETDDHGIFTESHPKNLQKSLEPLGVLDEVPTFENFKILSDMYSEWWKTVEESWTNYEKEKQKESSHLIALHWILGRVIQHPDVDPKILKYVVETSPKNVISVVHNRTVERLDVSSFTTKRFPEKSSISFLEKLKRLPSNVTSALTQTSLVRHSSIFRKKERIPT